MSSNLVAWAGDVADKILETALLKRAEAEARALVVRVKGLVINTEEEAAEVTDLVKRVGVGSRHLKDSLDTELAPLKLAQKTMTDRFIDLRSTLDDADKRGRDCLKVWQAEKARREWAEKELKRQERLAAEKAAIEAARRGEDLPPPAEDAPPPPASKSTYGSVGQSYATNPLQVEAIDWHEIVDFDPSLAKLTESPAKALYREAEKTMALDGATPHPSGGMVWHGMRFWREINVVVK